MSEQRVVSQQVSKTDKELNDLANSMNLKEYGTLGELLSAMGISSPENFFFLGKRKNIDGSLSTIGMETQSSLRGIEQVNICSHKIGG